MMVAVDLDCPHELADVQPGFRDALAAMHPAQSSRFDVLTANSRPIYYDLWTIRSKALLIDYDCWNGDGCSHDPKLPETFCKSDESGTCKCQVGSEQVNKRGSCHRYELTISPAAPMFAVDGGYSGFTIYNTDAIEHTGCHFNGDLACEIVPFQACLRSRQLRIGLVPNLISGCGGEHTRAATRAMGGKYRRKVFVSPAGNITYRTVREAMPGAPLQARPK